MDGLLDSGVVDAVVVAVPAELTDEAKLILGKKAVVVAGGCDRTESVRLALSSLSEAPGSEAPDFVLVHDAARPLTPPALIVRVVESLRAGHAAVVPALPLSDTIKAVDANGVVLGTPERAGLRAVQTPQGFATGLLLRAYRARLLGPMSPTTRPSSSRWAARSRWSTATRWRSRSPTSWICYWPKRSCGDERAAESARSAKGRFGHGCAPDRTRQALLAGWAAVCGCRRLRRTFRRRRGCARAV